MNDFIESLIKSNKASAKQLGLAVVYAKILDRLVGHAQTLLTKKI